jgi:hypothetical protein
MLGVNPLNMEVAIYLTLVIPSLAKGIPLMKNPKTNPRIHLFHEITGEHTMQGQQFMVQSTDLEDLQGLNNTALLVCATYIPETDLSIIRPRQ